MTQTLSFVPPRRDLDARNATLVSVPQLVLAMHCVDPCARPARFSLADVDDVWLGRGAERKRSRVVDGSSRQLVIQVPDAFMSSKHVRLFRDAGAWHAEDAGSKNGAFLNGERLERARLEDSDVLALGNTLFMYRAGMQAVAGEIDVDLSGISVSEAPLSTLHASLAEDLARLMRVAATSSLPVLVHGATGTGKELIARAVHARSGRAGPLVAVNCGALPPTLIASELFGVRKGAYSGATENRLGLVRGADGGTLFLDEIAELPLDAQAALLRVLQENEVVPVGSNQPVAVDARVVAATHQDLPRLVERGEFREDLYARVAAYTVTLPPLRERREDIGLIVGTLLAREGRSSTRFTLDAARALLNHPWPRNIRELEHCLMSALAIAGPEPIALTHLPASITAPAPPAVETDAQFLDLLRAHDGNVSAMARALGTSRSQVRRIAKRLDIDIAERRRR